MITPKDFRNGIVIKFNGELYTIISFQHIKPGKGGAFIRTKLKSVKLGSVIDKTFREGDAVQDIFVDQKKMQYLYSSGDHFHFMDTKDYEQIVIDRHQVEDILPFIKENAVVTINLHDGNVLSVSPPIFVKLKVANTEPGIRGNTARGGSKSAELETGYSVQVPLFINTGDILKIDTRTGKYVERA